MSVSSADDPVETIRDILDATDTTNWTNTKPNILRLDDSTPKGRENEQDDTIYIRSTATVDLDRFSADPVEQTEDASVDILVYTLDDTRGKDHTRDILEFMRDFMNDNFEQTGWHDIQPTNVTDTRGSRIERQTNHFVFVVEVELERIN